MLMKKILYLIAISSILLSACEKFAREDSVIADQPEQTVEDNKANLVEVSFTASSDLTKVAMDEYRNVAFSAGDRISIFANGNNYEFTTTEGGSVATFTGSMDAADVDAATFYALFPYSSSATIDEGVIKDVVLAKTSSPVAGGFASQQAVFVAKTTDNTLEFNSVCALLKITVPSGMTDLKTVDVFNRASELNGSLTGTFDVDMTSSEPAVTVTADTSSPHTVTLNSASYYEPGVYYIPVLPAYLSKGVDLKMTYSGNYIGRAASGAEITLEAGKVYNLGVLRKTKEYIYSSFENGFSYANEYFGNDGISVIDNPMVNAYNPSSKVMRLDMHTRSADSPTSGYIDFNINEIKFPISNGDRSFRKFFKTFRIKMYWGEINSGNANLKYYPKMYWGTGAGVSGLKQHPARLNGTAISTKDEFDAAFRANDWNELEWDYDQFEDGSAKTSWGWLESVRIRNFVNWDDGGLKTGDGYNLIVHWDDVAFVIK